MAYDPKTDSTQLIGIPYKEALKQLAKKQRRSLRATMELLIEDACKVEGIEVST